MRELRFMDKHGQQQVPPCRDCGLWRRPHRSRGNSKKEGAVEEKKITKQQKEITTH